MIHQNGIELMRLFTYKKMHVTCETCETIMQIGGIKRILEKHTRQCSVDEAMAKKEAMQPTLNELYQKLGERIFDSIVIDPEGHTYI